MDLLTKQLVDKSAAFNSSFSELRNRDNSITDLDVEYFEDKDIMGRFVRAYSDKVGYSSKFYYE